MDGIFSDDELQAAAATETPAQETEQQAAPPEQKTEERPRDEHGRFVAKEAEQAEGKPPEGHVPQGALHAERERRKSAEAELKRAQETLQAIATMREQVAQRKPEAQQVPSAEEDPTGVEHLKARIAELEAGHNTIRQERDNEALTQAENVQIQNVLAASEAAYRQQQPDYDEAINYVIKARAAELELYGLQPHEVRIALANEVADIARAAIQQGRDPAELGYRIAQSRGYRPATGEAGQAQGQGQRTVEAIAAAQGKSKSLGQAAGSTPTQITAEAIAQMSPQEFEALYATPEGRAAIDRACGAA